MDRACFIAIACVVALACSGDDDDAAGTTPVRDSGAISGEPHKTKPSCPTRVRDTLGDEFGYDCEQPEALALLETSPAPPRCSGGQTAEYRLRSGERLQRVCYVRIAQDGSERLTSSSCRPLACERHDDCPDRAECLHGVCQQLGRRVTTDDAIALCLADIAWPRDCSNDASDPTYLQRAAPIFSSCSGARSACPVPAACRQP